MIWQEARWRWPLLAVGIMIGCLLAFIAQTGEASSPAGPTEQSRMAATNTADGSVQVTLRDAESGSALRQVRWAYGAVAASGILLVAAIQYRAYRRLHEHRRPVPIMGRSRRRRRPLNQADGHIGPWPVVEPQGPGKPTWTPGLDLKPGIGD